jgi:hypothetical protein
VTSKIASIFGILGLFISICGHAEKIEFGIIGDAGSWNENTKTIRDSMTALSTNRKLILPGDNLYGLSNTYKKAWKPWRENQFTFDVVAIGNHTEGYKEEVAYFEMPGQYYAKAYGDTVRFLVLNSDNTKNVPLQLNWLERELARASEPLIFLVYHHPTYTISEDHSWDEKEQFQLGIRQIIERHRKKITGLLLGHDHIASILHFRDLPAIVSGSTQNPRTEKPIDNIQQNIHMKTT